MILSRLYTCVNILLLTFIIQGCEKEEENNTNGKSTAVFNASKTYGTMTDQDGNIYKTIIIGNQTWMAENLRTTKYRDGSAIPKVSDSLEWSNLTTGAYCPYRDTLNPLFIATYGRLYNWYAVNTGMLAPEGWHIPTKNEWQTLEEFIGLGPGLGGKLKETGTLHWEDPNAGATNASGFTALPSGIYGYPNTRFYSLGKNGFYWTTTSDNEDYAFGFGLNYYYADVFGGVYLKKIGFSVRLIKNY